MRGSLSFLLLSLLTISWSVARRESSNAEELAGYSLGVCPALRRQDTTVSLNSSRSTLNSTDNLGGW